MTDLGKLAKLDPRNVWANEAYDFTPWLAENLDALGEVLGLELELESREAPAGDFSVDILARDLGSGESVIIENQLAPTNHDHHGKLITYASAYDAAAVIWVTPSFHEEHRQALDWLNQHTDNETGFFGVLVDVVRIDDSRPAFTFRPVAFPNEWQKERSREARAAPSSRALAYEKFFQGLIDELREKHQFTNARAAQPQNWYSFTSGTRGIQYAASFAQRGRARAEVYIDVGNEEENKRLFDALHASKEELEQAFGKPLEWERLDDRRASRVAVYRSTSILENAHRLDEIRDWFVARLLRFQQVFGPQIGKILPAQDSTER